MLSRLSCHSPFFSEVLRHELDGRPTRELCAQSPLDIGLRAQGFYSLKLLNGTTWCSQKDMHPTLLKQERLFLNISVTSWGCQFVWFCCASI